MQDVQALKLAVRSVTGVVGVVSRGVLAVRHVAAVSSVKEGRSNEEAIEEKPDKTDRPRLLAWSGLSSQQGRYSCYPLHQLPKVAQQTTIVASVRGKEARDEETQRKRPPLPSSFVPSFLPTESDQKNYGTCQPFLPLLLAIRVSEVSRVCPCPSKILAGSSQHLRFFSTASTHSQLFLNRHHDHHDHDGDRHEEQTPPLQTLRAWQAAAVPSVHDAPVIRRPGEVVDIATVTRNYWAFPAVGFNSILELPVYRFDVLPGEELSSDSDPDTIVVPNGIFGLPIRPDHLHLCYVFHRTAIAGWSERMQLYKWEWPKSNRKVRSQKRSGKARMGARKVCGKYYGVQGHPIRPFDARVKIQKRFLWKGLQIMLSAKFAQDQIKVVDSFCLRSHKTKYAVQYLRRLLGRRCNSALLVHEGHDDVNDNFRWATAHIAAVRRENVEGVSVYNLLRYRQLVITEKALQKLILEIEDYPNKREWLRKYATPNGMPAAVPKPVKGWNVEWRRKAQERKAEFTREMLLEQVAKWKWSTSPKGPMKIPRVDPLRGFRVKDFTSREVVPQRRKYEDLEMLEDFIPLAEGENGDDEDDDDEVFRESPESSDDGEALYTHESLTKALSH